MSRRHNASRRRSYGRRQHEVRERRTGISADGDWQPLGELIDFPRPDPVDDRHAVSGSDGLGGERL